MIRPVCRRESVRRLGHPTSNIEHPTSNIEHPTSNIEHPTSDIQRQTSNAARCGTSLGVGCWMFVVGCFPEVRRPYAVAAALRWPRLQRTIAHSPTKPAVTSANLTGQSVALAL